MNIVAGVTERPESEAALERAIEEARFRSAHLYIVRGLGRSLNENPGMAQRWAADIADLEAEGARLVERLAKEGIDATFRVEPVTTDPADVPGSGEVGRRWSARHRASSPITGRQARFGQRSAGRDPWCGLSRPRRQGIGRLGQSRGRMGRPRSVFGRHPGRDVRARRSTWAPTVMAPYRPGHGIAIRPNVLERHRVA